MHISFSSSAARTEKGFGKRSDLDDYRETNRGGKGVKTISITDKTGALIAIKNVKDTDDLMIINKSGIILRMAVKDLRVVGRNTQGVKLINLKSSDAIASVTQVPAEEEELQLDENETGVNETALNQPEPDGESNEETNLE